MELLLEQIEKAPVNQLPMYVEKTAEIISAPFAKKLLQILNSRTDVLAIPTKAKRIEKLARGLKDLIKD
jgi:Mg2+/Co2+ transporter CorB